MTISSFKKGGYTQRYKVGDVIKAFKKMPEYRRGFKTSALSVGGVIRKELGSPEERITGKALINYLKTKRDFSHEKIKSFFKNLSTITNSQSPQKSIIYSKKQFESPQFQTRKSPQDTAEWIKEIGRQRILIEKKAHTNKPLSPKKLFGSKSIIKQPLSPKTSSPSLNSSSNNYNISRIKPEENYNKPQEQNTQKIKELDEKEKEEENKINQLMKERFGSQNIEQKTTKK